MHSQTQIKEMKSSQGKLICLDIMFTNVIKSVRNIELLMCNGHLQ